MLSFRRLLRGKTTFGMRLPPPPQTAGSQFFVSSILSKRLSSQSSSDDTNVLFSPNEVSIRKPASPAKYLMRTAMFQKHLPCKFPVFCQGTDRRRLSCPVVEFLLYIIVDHVSWLLMFYLAISRGGIPPRLVLSGGYAASLMYFVRLPSCGDVPREEELFFCKTYGSVNVSLNPISWLSCVLRRRDLLRRS